MIELKITVEHMEEFQSILKRLAPKVENHSAEKKTPEVAAETAPTVTDVLNNAFGDIVKTEDVGYDSSLDTQVPVESDDIPADLSLDSAGNSWDGSIHAATKTTTQNGEWKKKRIVKKSAEPAAPVEKRIDTLLDFTNYAKKLNAEGTTFVQLTQFLHSISIPKIGLLPPEKFHETALQVKSEFGVEF